ILADMGAQATTPMAGVVLDPLLTSSPPPTGVTATAAGGDSIRISWQPVAGATSYNVYRTLAPRDGGYPLGAKVNPTPVTGTSFTDFDLASNTTYYYAVSSVTGTTEGPPSADASSRTTTVFSTPVRLNSGGSAFTTLSGAIFAADGQFTG